MKGLRGGARERQRAAEQDERRGPQSVFVFIGRTSEASSLPAGISHRRGKARTAPLDSHDTSISAR
jgi:hypothetical protein